MWIAKGIFVGLAIFVVGSVVFGILNFIVIATMMSRGAGTAAIDIRSMFSVYRNVLKQFANPD